MKNSERDPPRSDRKPIALPFVIQEAPDFSLVLGGPIFQFFRRSHLSGDGLELLHRRIGVITLVAWLPFKPAGPVRKHRWPAVTDVRATEARKHG